MMVPSTPLVTQESFNRLAQALTDRLSRNEQLELSLTAENTHYVRINNAKVRQSGIVEDARFGMTLYVSNEAGIRKATVAVTLTGDADADLTRTRAAMKSLQETAPGLPVDPYATRPVAGTNSSQTKRGVLPNPSEAVGLLAKAAGFSRGSAKTSSGPADLVGIYASGTVIRASANSEGLRHWFETDNLDFDYTLMSSSERAVKGTYAVHEWDPEALAANLEASRQKLKLLERPVKSIPRGIYRTFLEPAAVAELLSLFSWDCIGEKSIRLKQSPLRFLREGNRTLSPHFSLKEDFTNDDIPRFNEAGELAPEVMHLICNGQLAGTLISSSTAKEYNLKHTGAASDERLRAPCMSGGGLAGGDILKRLDTGMLISNLHYLNWSDHSGGGMTGMTRYACFWVENGKIAAPIENLRFDDNLFTLFGSAVEAVTSDVVSVPLVQTYFHRQLGATRTPGMLLSRMRFTL